MSLTPWIEARREHLGGHEFKICAVSVPFEGFDHGNEPEDSTRAILRVAVQYNEIDHAIVRDKPMRETEARTLALQWLMRNDVDIVWQVDSDEEYTNTAIFSLASYVETTGYYAWYRINFLNLVFTEKLALKDRFTPPRIHRTAWVDLRAGWFYEDNNIDYKTMDPGRLIKDVQLASVTIPEPYGLIAHHTWLNNERSRKKVQYQQLRWGPPNGAGCSFAWNEARGGLTWNEEYFKLTGQPLPEIISL